MTDTASMREIRRSKGIEIASHDEDIESLGENAWSVPSQAEFGRYKVWFVGDLPLCACPDFDGRSGDPNPSPCKHIYAVVALRLHEVSQSLAATERKPRKQYAKHPTYTEAQTAERRLLDSLLRDLVADVPELPKVEGKCGRPAIPLSDALYCSILKVYSGLAGRRARGVYENVSDRGLLGRVPSYNVASRALNRPETTAVPYRLLRLSAAPRAVSVGSGAHTVWVGTRRE